MAIPAQESDTDMTDTNGGPNRRDLLKGSLVFSVVGAVAGRAVAQESAAPGVGGNVVIRGGHVLTMDPSLPDLPVGDVHVSGGRIIAVGDAIDAPDAEIIDATDMIVMPGFVDTHSHLWNAFLRGSIRGDDQVRGYFPTTNRAAPLCTPEEARISARFGMMEALLSGTTCVNNFSHNTRSTAHADAEIQAGVDLGMRSRFSYGTPGRGERLDTAGVEETVARWANSNELVTLGVNLQLPAPDVLAGGGEDDAFVGEVAFAKAAGLPITLHYGNTAHGLVGFMDRHGMLGPDTLFVHTQGFTPEERETLVSAGVPFSMSPAIEIPYSTVRNGYIQFGELEALGADLSLSVDASSAMATADPFIVMRALQWSHKQRGDIDRTLAPKRIVEIATLGGAKALGMDSEIGSLTPGKAADIILVRKSDINMVPVIDPYFSLVYSGGAHNVQGVMVGGRLVAWGREHLTVPVAEVVRDADAAGRAMHEKLEAIIAEGAEDPAQANRRG